MASFKDAFRAARGAGKKTFKWNGKSYTTKLASAAPKVPVPSKRPDPTTTGSIPKPTPKPAANVPTPTRKPSNPAATQAINASTRASVDAQNAGIRAQIAAAKKRAAGLKIKKT